MRRRAEQAHAERVASSIPSLLSGTSDRLGASAARDETARSDAAARSAARPVPIARRVPTAAAAARRSRAAAAAVRARIGEAEEEKRTVAALTTVRVGTLVEAWSAPTAVEARQALLTLTAGRGTLGMAPQARQFR